MKRFKGFKAWAVLAVLLVLSTLGAQAQVTIPYAFSTKTTISSVQVNTNFSTLGTQSLNRTGGTMTGTLTSRNIVPSADATYSFGDGTHRFINGFFSGAVASGTVSTGALSATTGSFSGAITGPSVALTGNVSAATGTFSGTINGQTITSTASFTGSLTTAGALVGGTTGQINGDLTVGTGGTGATNRAIFVDGGSGAASIGPYLAFRRNSVTQAVLGVAGSSNGIILGAASNDYALQNSGPIIFSANSGTTLQGKMHASGGFSWGSVVDPGAGNLSVSSVVQVKGTSPPSSGAGVEVSYDGTQGILLGFDRSGGLYKPLGLDGSLHDFFISGTPKGRMHASGGFSWGDLTDPGSANFRVSGTSRFIGRVGIGSATGTDLLHVTGGGGQGISTTDTDASGRTWSIGELVTAGTWNLYDGTAGQSRISVLGSTGDVTIAKLLQVAGFGTHTHSAGGTGGNRFQVRNTTAGTGNFGAVEVGNDASSTLLQLQAFSSTFTTVSYTVANGAAVMGEGVGGLSLGSLHASGTTRFYTNSALRGTMHASGGFSWGSATDPGATNMRVEGSFAVIGGMTAANLLTSGNVQLTAGAVITPALRVDDPVAAPTKTIAVVQQFYYGTTGDNLLGEPNVWLRVNVNGTSYKIPVYQ